MLKPFRRALPLALLAAFGTPVTASSFKFLLSDQDAAGVSGLVKLYDYGSFALYASSAPVLELAGGRRQADPGFDRLGFSAQPFDTQREALAPPAPFALDAPAGAGLQVVQFVGPVREEWLDDLRAQGIVPVHYVASHGYVVWVDAAARTRLDALRGAQPWLQYAAPLYGFLKVDPLLQRRLDRGEAAADGEVDVIVQIYRHGGDAATRDFVERLARLAPAQQGPLGPGTFAPLWEPVLAFDNLALRVRVADLPAIAERPDVVFVGEQLTMQPMDEKQNLILTGDLFPGPASTRYLDRLRAWGFSENPLDYPVVDVTDSPLHEGGSGATAVATADRKLYAGGDTANASRVVYFTNCSSASAPGDVGGHGSLNAGIVAGFDARSGAPFQDADGWLRGQGVNPFGRVGSTAIFVPGFDTSACGNGPAGLIRANWRAGARISNNSWGSNPPPATYEAVQQAYDAGVRDADATQAGNQDMIYVMAAGNLGAGGAYTVSSPAAAKNVIAVGASENVRPSWTDGCQIAAGAADDPNDVAPFSSRGPTRDGRAKPEAIAPGTHVQAGASVYSGYAGNGICDAYYPAGQTEFAASSGTSHSAPAVAGIASLAYWWMQHGGAGSAAGSVDRVDDPDHAPSAAAMKAWLIAHPAYLTGLDANDTLPSPTQGYGMPDMGQMFDTVTKVVVDQTEVLTASGQSATYRWAVLDPARPLRIALAYTDAPGLLGTSPQVNDLDLVVSSGARSWLGNVFDGGWSQHGGTADAVNNYEAVFLPPGSAEDVQITVTARNIAGDALNTGGLGQDFALVCYNCVRAPGFTLEPAAPVAHACAGRTVPTPIRIGQIAGFADPVTLAATSSLSGAAFAFDPNPAVPGTESMLQITAPAGAPAGMQALTVTGQTGATTKTLELPLGVYAGLPAAAAMPLPADGSSSVDIMPTFSWTGSADAYGYRVQIATDAAFTHLVAQIETADTQWTLGPAEALDSNRRYWWRVAAVNACGTSTPLAPADTLFRDGFEAAAALPDAQAFVTAAVPSDCPLEQTPVRVYADDLETGAPGWTHGAIAGSDGWQLGSAALNGLRAWQASAPAAGAANDQWLATGPIALPSDLTRPSLRFWHRQSLKASVSGANCQDAGIVEITADGGQTWTQLTAGLEATPYDGPVSGAFQNPLAGRQAWCGDPRGYVRTVAALDGYAGRTVQLRFRLGHDRFDHRPGINWAIDDLTVQACPAP
ncbi:MAG TPA: S8 family serine peptidase [Dokdonella sp.]|uniref:S8 family serine peptidase n=1 Tax=Dokdonella sp. TaxID=2291710 RepID=UPI002B8FD067|nr:S8 family serine peptidase [Dokdonella sp.]HUD40870.1 S8 family serine peptidase [Dokdonella sp.]